MNVDRILEALNAHQVAYLLIGGVHFLLRHAPVLTYDVDVWVEDTPENIHRCEQALSALGAEWGASTEAWEPVARKRPGWLEEQTVFCLTSPQGAIDIFRAVRGLPDWNACRQRATACRTAGGIVCQGLCDEDMLLCQLALPEGERNVERIRVLRKALGHD